MFVADTVLIQQFGQNEAIELGPPRPCHTANIADKLDVVLLQQLEKIGKRMPAMADGVDRRMHLARRYGSLGRVMLASLRHEPSEGIPPMETVATVGVFD